MNRVWLRICAIAWYRAGPGRRGQGVGAGDGGAGAGSGLLVTLPVSSSTKWRLWLSLRVMPGGPMIILLALICAYLQVAKWGTHSLVFVTPEHVARASHGLSGLSKEGLGF